MFWDVKNIDPNLPALEDDAGGGTLSYGELNAYSDSIADHIRSDNKKLALLLCDNSLKSVLIYVSILKSGNAVFPVNTKMDQTLKKSLIDIYKPEIIFSTDPVDFLAGDYKKITVDSEISYYLSSGLNGKEIFRDVALLLSTSATTGSPKLVKLSYSNIQSNAESIAEYLNITSDERPITSLPMSYSFGISVINSHLLKGAKILCSNKSMVMREFWNTFNKNGCTSFSGVPYNYQMLQRLKFDRMELPTLRTLTQAGGRLSEEFIKFFYETSINKGIKFFVMYGQTEAAPRISYVPFDKLGKKIGSIGVPVPGGKIQIQSDGSEITEPGKEGELVYIGPNVMLGYAENRSELASGDEMNGVLHTGDLAYKDSDGYTYITGRLKRFIKLFGLRVNLDEVEKMLENTFKRGAACYGSDDMLKILIQKTDKEISDEVKRKVIDTYKLHHSVVSVKCVSDIPVTSSGKRDYKKIQETEL